MILAIHICISGATITTSVGSLSPQPLQNTKLTLTCTVKSLSSDRPSIRWLVIVIQNMMLNPSPLYCMPICFNYQVLGKNSIKFVSHHVVNVIDNATL